MQRFEEVGWVGVRGTSLVVLTGRLQCEELWILRPFDICIHVYVCKQG